MNWFSIMKKDNEAEFIAEVKSKLPQVEGEMERRIIEKFLDRLESTDSSKARKKRMMIALAEIFQDNDISLSSLPLTAFSLDAESEEILSDMNSLRADIQEIEEAHGRIAKKIVKLAKNTDVGKDTERKQEILAFARDYADKDLQELAYYGIEEEFEEIVRGEI